MTNFFERHVAQDLEKDLGRQLNKEHSPLFRITKICLRDCRRCTVCTCTQQTPVCSRQAGQPANAWDGTRWCHKWVWGRWGPRVACRGGWGCSRGRRWSRTRYWSWMWWLYAFRTLVAILALRPGVWPHSYHLSDFRAVYHGIRQASWTYLLKQWLTSEN